MQPQRKSGQQARQRAAWLRCVLALLLLTVVPVGILAQGSPQTVGVDVNAAYVAMLKNRPAQGDEAELKDALVEDFSNAQFANASAADRDIVIALLAGNGARAASLTRVQGEMLMTNNAREALAAFHRAVLYEPGNAKNFRLWGDAAMQVGKLAEAEQAYRTLQSLVELQVGKKTGDLEFQRDLFASYERIGDMLARQGKTGEALAAYRNGLVISKKIALADPDDNQTQHGVSVIDERIGDMLVLQGQRGEALTMYRNSLSINEKLAEVDADNSWVQRGLSISYNRIGDMLAQQGQNGEALEAYHNGLVIAEKLAKADPTNSTAQRDLFFSHNNIGDMLAKRGRSGEALAAYQSGLVIAEKLTAADPNNAQAQKDIIVSLMKQVSMRNKGVTQVEALQYLLRATKIAILYDAQTHLEQTIGLLVLLGLFAVCVLRLRSRGRLRFSRPSRA